MAIPAAKAGQAAGPLARDLEAAYVRCEEMVRAHYENFPVVSRFLHKDIRRALAAVYAFARGADDLADEGYGHGGPSTEERLAALDAWERSFRSVCGPVIETPSEPPEVTQRTAETSSSSLGSQPPEIPMPSERSCADPASEARRDAVFTALGDTIRRYDLPPALFLDLLSAFRQDVVKSRYETREEVLDYCRRSANPVGRIVLALHGVRDAGNAALSDAICTGLQLANFWQDVGVDKLKDRVYLPRADRIRYGVTEEDLAAPVAAPALRALLLDETGWSRSFFEAGRPLITHAPDGLAFHLRLVWHGGMRILEMIEAAKGDVLAKRPKLGRTDLARLLFRAVSRGGAR